MKKEEKEKKMKKKKSVNWDTKVQDNEQNSQDKKDEGKSGEFLEIEVINKDGNTVKERVNYETKESKEFVKKREEKMHNEYTKAKEFLENHKNEE